MDADARERAGVSQNTAPFLDSSVVLYRGGSAAARLAWGMMLTLVQELVRGRAVGLSQEISMDKDGKQVVETAVEARGGLLDRPVLLVLLVSCVLAVAALIVTYSGA
jgi:hypothetical protein